jgi:hypothetical protein
MHPFLISTPEKVLNSTKRRISPTRVCTGKKDVEKI